MAVFSSPEAGLSAAATEAAASVAHLAKLIEGLNGAVECARLEGLGDDEIADQLSALPAVPVAVRAALTADGDGRAMRLLVASLVAVPDAVLEGTELASNAVGRTPVARGRRVELDEQASWEVRS